MDVKKLCLILFVATLLIGSVCAADDLSKFKADKTYYKAISESYYRLYLNEHQDSGITIYKNVDKFNAKDNIYWDLIHDDGRDYINGDNNITVVKNDGKIAYFADNDHKEHGVVEIVKKKGKEYIVVSWAKDNSGINNTQLISKLHKFNKKNKITPIEL